MVPRRTFLPPVGASLAMAALLLRAGIAPARAAEPEQAPVFTSGQEGYHTYPIPALLVTKKGTLLAFCKGRKKGGGDAGDIDLLLKRSLNGGKTWAQTPRVWGDSDNTCDNPCPVLDATTGTVWLLLTHNLGSDTEAQIIAGTSKGPRLIAPGLGYIYMAAPSPTNDREVFSGPARSYRLQLATLRDDKVTVLTPAHYLFRLRVRNGPLLSVSPAGGAPRRAAAWGRCHGRLSSSASTATRVQPAP